jgi:hypothetical protein
MKDVKVDRGQLLKIVKKNMETHKEIVLKAQKAYREELQATLEKMLADIQAGKKVNTYIHIQPPIDQTSSYRTAIAMLEMSLEAQIVLTEREFQQYVEDQWSWSGSFYTQNSSLLNCSAQALGGAAADNFSDEFESFEVPA